MINFVMAYMLEICQ